jgi:hypothetical protein
MGNPIMIAKILRVFLLVVMTAILPTVASSQERPVRFGAPPAQIAGDSWTEEHWIVNEIIRDITEMSAYAIKRSARPMVIRVETVRPGLYRLSANELSGTLPLDLNRDIWNPDSFAPIALAGLGKAGSRRHVRDHSEVYPSLLELTPFQLRRISAELSRDLADNMANAPLHEAAALTIGAFALREAAGYFHDVRGSLNRMTAHLAMAPNDAQYPEVCEAPGVEPFDS